MSDSFIKRITKKPPTLFPLVALFHIGLYMFLMWNTRSEPFPSGIWMQPLLMLCYTVSWIFICDMKRWAALVYIALTTINLMLRFLVKSPVILNDLTDVLFPADVLFSFFLMFYFRQFE